MTITEQKLVDVIKALIDAENRYSTGRAEAWTNQEMANRKTEARGRAVIVVKELEG